MSRLGLLSPPETGHLNPSLGLAQALRDRGHEVIFYQLADGKHRIEAEGFRCRVYGERDYPPGSLEAERRGLGRLTGLQAARYTAKLGETRLAVASRELLELSRSDKLDGMVADEVMVIGRTLGEVLQIPVVTISNALPLKLDATVPPPLVGWPYRERWLDRVRNRTVNWLIDQLAKPGLRIVNRLRAQHGLSSYDSLDQLASPLAHLCQIPASFDFPRTNLPASFHYTGPFDSFARRPSVEFPFPKLSNLPLVYVSFGTLQNRVKHHFHAIAQALGRLPVQAVLSLGGGRDPSEFTDLPNNVMVVKYAPQTELLKRASLCVTHAGMNTTLECLAHGVPMIAIPVTNDQPAVAARIVYHQVGQRLALSQLRGMRFRGRRLTATLQKVLEESGYRKRAQEFAQEIRQNPGGAQAAVIIESRVSS